MKNPFFEGIIAVVLFFGIWLGLSQIEWIKILKIEQSTQNSEEKIGELLWDSFRKYETEIADSSILNSIDSLVEKICKANGLNRKKIKVHLLNKNESNAFALPNGHLVLYSELILNAENQEELAGVICHEIAHIELNHVMKKLIKEIGLSTLISVTTGGGSSEIIKESAKILSSTAFDRKLEKQADLKGVDYLLAAKLNPKPFANFLYNLSEEQGNISQYLNWVSTHPDSKERAEYIIEYSKDKSVNYKPVLSQQSWDALQERLKQLTQE